MFEMLGLDSAAESTYEALLRNGSMTVGDLSVAGGLRPARLRTVLRQLQTHGLASRIPGAPVRYSAVDPDIALDVLLLRQEERLRQARIQAREFSERHRRETTGRDPAEPFEVVVGQDNVTQRVQQAQRSARQQLRYFDKPPYASDPRTPNPAELDFLRTGGTARVLYERSAIEMPGRLPDLEVSLESGELARVCAVLPTKLVLVDDRLALLPLSPAPLSIVDSCVIVHRSSLLDALSALFEALWAVAVPLEHTARGPSSSHDDRRLLALLTAGLSDAAIGRQLGISYRTLQRRIHRLMTGMHAQNRFQLGVRSALPDNGPDPRAGPPS